MASKFCSMPGCTNRQRSKTFCNKHRPSKPPTQVCMVKGCKTLAYAGNLCAKHGGDHQNAHLCKVALCQHKVRANNLCALHGSGVGSKFCSMPGCTNRQRSKTFCTKHRPSKPPAQVCMVKGCKTIARARKLCVKHGANGTCSIQNCTTNVQRKGLCSVHLHPLGGLQSANIHCGNSLATRLPGHTTVKAQKLKILKARSRTPFPHYFVGKLNAKNKWAEVERLSSSNKVLTTTVPLKLPSGNDPYEADVDSPISIKEEMHQAMLDKMAFLHRLLKKRRIYGHSTAIPYDETDPKQFPLKPREKKRADDTCGWCINQKHYLFRRWCAQQQRCLTAQEHKSSLDYAERDPPLNGQIFEYYFSGNAYLTRKERSTRLGSKIQNLTHLSELGFAEYAISFDLKRRPQHLADSHDRLDNDQGYTFKNVISNSILAQNNNRGTKMMRTKYRNQIQDEFYGTQGRTPATTTNQKAVATVTLIDPKRALAAAFRTARRAKKILNTPNKTKNQATKTNESIKHKKRKPILDSRGKPRNTLYGYQ